MNDVEVNKSLFLNAHNLSRPTIPLLRVKGISKRFGNVIALDDVSLDIYDGEIHALLGENGAGKTTLANILYGIYQPDSGYIELSGRKIKLGTPQDAISYGIVLVQQYPMLIDKMTVAENLALSIKDLGYLSSVRKIYGLIREISIKYDISLEPEMIVSNLSFSEKQYVELLRALILNAKILILDEPTTMLTTYERRKLFVILRKLIDEGRAVVLITHKVSEALEVSDRITVLRRGAVVSSRPKSEYDYNELVKLIMGSNVNDVTPVKYIHRQRSAPPEDVLVIKELNVANDIGLIAVRNVSLSVKAGEIVGIAGVSGNGQKELAEAIVGLRRVRSGRIVLSGVDVTNKEPYERIKNGLAYIPEDRLKYGIVGEMSVAENFILKNYKAFSKLLFINMRKVMDFASKNIDLYHIVTRSPLERAKVLSGGNIQKLIVSRELGLNTKVVLAHNPTLGLDIASAKLVHNELLNVRDRGAGILLISEDLDEVIKLSDRILVMYRGSIVYDVSRDKLSIGDIEKAMLGLLNA